MNHLLNHISDSSRTIMANRKEYSLNENIQIYIKDPVTNNIRFS